MRRSALLSAVVAASISLVVGGASVGTARPGAARVCGAAWTAAPLPAISGSGGLEDVAASSPTDAWAVGHRFDPGDQKGHTLIEHHDGTSWTITPSADGPSAPQSELSGVAARTSTDAWAVGSFTKANNLIRTLVERWDGSAWTRVKSPNAGQPAGGQLSARRGARRRRRLGRRLVRAGRAQPDPDRALGRHGVDGRAEPEQGAVPERAVRYRRGGPR